MHESDNNFNIDATLDLYADDIESEIGDLYADDEAAEAWAWATDQDADLRL